MATTKQVDILDIIFSHKNKDYGAYVLRRNYKFNLSKAMWIAIILFVLATSSSLIINYLSPKETVDKKKAKAITFAQLSELPDVKKDQAPPPDLAPPPLKTTMKFTVPVVKPDEKVLDDYVPSQEELRDVDPGAKTQEGTNTGDISQLFTVDESQDVVVEEEKEVKQQVFEYVEEMPTYPGGQEALMQYFAANIVYPEIAKKAGVEGKVFVQFVVSKDGSISNATVLKGIGGGCDEEAIRVVRKMPKWIPGKQNGAPVNVNVKIPIFFKLQ
ncbi:MAG: energy transducer TonB [Syntrophothermus sp.]|nr:energy transducer TonB [Ignavibacteriaceae bacterium]